MNRVCDYCIECFVTAVDHKVYCSVQCRNKAAYQRAKASGVRNERVQVAKTTYDRLIKARDEIMQVRLHKWDLCHVCRPLLENVIGRQD